jgi:hypothetical protein
VGKLVRAGSALALAATLVVAAGGVASAKTVPDSKYSKVLCKSFKANADSVKQLVTAYNALPVDNPAAFQTSAAGLIDKVIATVQANQKKLKKLSPQDGGKQVTKILDKYFTSFSKNLTDAVTKFRAADPTGVAFQADVTQLQVAINLLDVQTMFPTSDLNAANNASNLASAIDKEKSCKGIINITTVGG